MTQTMPQPTTRPLTVEDYHRMGKAGIFAQDERIQLIDGEIIQMPPIGSSHACLTAMLNHTLTPAVGSDAIVWVQGPLRLSDLSEPEPDLMLLLPRDNFYRNRTPLPEEVLLAIEISQSSLRFDRDRKLPLYALAGIPETWLVDVQGQTLTHYSMPADGRYSNATELDLFHPIALPSLDRHVDLSQLFG